MAHESGYTLIYQVWVKGGQEEALREAWLQQVGLLRELGVIDGWVVTYEGGRCDSYLVWQDQSLWVQAQRHCNFFEHFLKRMGDNIIGWFSPTQAAG